MSQVAGYPRVGHIESARLPTTDHGVYGVAVSLRVVESLENQHGSAVRWARSPIGEHGPDVTGEIDGANERGVDLTATQRSGGRFEST
jgi:hypothetical protein